MDGTRAGPEGSIHQLSTKHCAATIDESPDIEAERVDSIKHDRKPLKSLPSPHNPESLLLDKTVPIF